MGIMSAFGLYLSGRFTYVGPGSITPVGRRWEGVLCLPEISRRVVRTMKARHLMNGVWPFTGDAREGKAREAPTCDVTGKGNYKRGMEKEGRWW